MSRTGNAVITIPAGTTVEIAENNHVVVKGSKGELTRSFHPDLEIKNEENEIKVARPNDKKEMRQLHGTTRALIANMVEGVTNGYKKELEIHGVGYRVQKQGNGLQIQIGFSHPVDVSEVNGITFDVPSQTEIVVEGIDKELVGKVAAEIRDIKKPEPYKGKGIRYKGEYVRRKEGKKAA